jgi:hypothetical protein
MLNVSHPHNFLKQSSHPLILPCYRLFVSQPLLRACPLPLDTPWDSSQSRLRVLLASAQRVEQRLWDDVNEIFGCIYPLQLPPNKGAFMHR